MHFENCCDLKQAAKFIFYPKIVLFTLISLRNKIALELCFANAVKLILLQYSYNFENFL